MSREGLTTEDTEKHKLGENYPQITQITQIGRQEELCVIGYLPFLICHLKGRRQVRRTGI